jgi:hypothetical protein
MIFGGDATGDESYQRRCHSWGEAEAQHAEALKIAQAQVAAAEKATSSW